MAKVFSKNAPVTEPITITHIGSNTDLIEIGVTFFSDASLETVVDSGMTGTVQLSATPSVNSYDQNIINGNLDLTSSSSFSTPVRIDTKVSSITATPNTVTGATHYQLVISGELT